MMALRLVTLRVLIGSDVFCGMSKKEGPRMVNQLKIFPYEISYGSGIRFIL